ncbi:Protein dead ringer [Eumeta japonica]|uniref:Protein dead ringer n=1 Tax=Eumeta variegata TaxID=151549 RepID=A0A4C1TK15_EUMVA|nr:Protein dead ringer [Eumeta japonica]
MHFLLAELCSNCCDTVLSLQKLLYEISDDPQRKEFLDDLFSFMQKTRKPVRNKPVNYDSGRVRDKSVKDLLERDNAARTQRVIRGRRSVSITRGSAQQIDSTIVALDEAICFGNNIDACLQHALTCSMQPTADPLICLSTTNFYSKD